LATFCKHRQQILQVRDLLLEQQDVRIVQQHFHRVRLGHEVRAQVALVELHAFDHVQRGLDALGFFDGDRPVLAHLVHRLRDDLADGVVAVRRDGADLRDLRAFLHLLALLLQRRHDRPGGQVDALADIHRAGAGGDVLQAFAVDRLDQHRRRRRSVAGDVARLARHFAHHLGAHVLERILQLDFLGDRHAVLGDRRAAELLFEHHGAAARAQRALDGPAQLLDALQHVLAGFRIICNLFC
jgi:hypothetical protein